MKPLAPYSLTVHHLLLLNAAPSFRPLSFKAVNTTSTSIHLEWEAPPPEHHNGIIRSYTVLCSERDSNDSMMELSTSIREVTVKELSPFLTYSCKVSAVSVSQGPYSDSLDITTLEDGKFCNSLTVPTKNFTVEWCFTILHCLHHTNFFFKYDTPCSAHKHLVYKLHNH